MSRAKQLALLLASVAVVVAAATTHDLLVLHVRPSPQKLAIPSAIGALFGVALLALARSRSAARAARALAAEQEEEIAGLNARLSETVRRQGGELRTAERRIVEADRLAAVGLLAGGVAHDFNNLLSVVVAGSSCLQGVVGPGEATEVVECMRSAGARGATLTRQLLMIARPQGEAEGPEARAAACLNRCVGELSPLLARLMGPASTLEVRRCDGALVVPLPASAIEQVLLNLIVNARDAMPGGGRVVVETVRHGGTARLVVRDEGTGMPEEVRRRIFDPFFTTKGEGRGSGIGLAVVRAAVERARGRVEVESAPGAGTTFSLEFPLRAEQLVDPFDPATMRPPAAGVVVLVDEDVSLRRIAGTLLDRAGHRVHTCTGHRDALACIARELDPAAPAWLVADLLLADGAGEALPREARLLRPDLAVVLTTATGSRSTLPRATLLPKPYGTEELLQALATSRLALGG